MLTLELALQLQAAGVGWSDPQPGDRFIVPVEGLRDQVFVLSDMTSELHQHPAGAFIGFNGTTEWALDSVQKDQVVWLPREDQLRDLLGEHFLRLERLEGGFAVVTRADEADAAEERHVDIDAEWTYARAVLAIRHT